MKRRDLLKALPAVMAAPVVALATTSDTSITATTTSAPPPIAVGAPREDDNFQKLRPHGQIRILNSNFGLYVYRGFRLHFTGWKYAINRTLAVGQWIAYLWDEDNNNGVPTYLERYPGAGLNNLVEAVGVYSSFPGDVGWFRRGEEFDISTTEEQSKFLHASADKGLGFYRGIPEQWHEAHAFGKILDFIDKKYSQPGSANV